MSNPNSEALMLLATRTTASHIANVVLFELVNKLTDGKADLMLEAVISDMNIPQPVRDELKKLLLKPAQPAQSDQ